MLLKLFEPFSYCSVPNITANAYPDSAEEFRIYQEFGSQIATVIPLEIFDQAGADLCIEFGCRFDARTAVFQLEPKEAPVGF